MTRTVTSSPLAAQCRLAGSMLGIFIAVSSCVPPRPAPGSASEPVDLGRHHLEITTSSSAAQRHFDRGLILAFAFSHEAAEAEFRRATELDPGAPLPWWGIALVNGPHINFPLMPPENVARAWDALTKATERSAAGTPFERALIAALGRRYVADPSADRAPLDRAYADAMRDVTRAFPESADARTLLAESLMDLRPWDLWQADGTPQPETPEILAALERAMQLDADHPGAHHLYIHAVEASPNPDRASSSAEKLRTIAPGAGHLVHMPAHIFARLGRWDDVISANQAAIGADDAYRRAHPRPGLYAMYMAHNFHFLTFGYMMQGRRQEAVAIARKFTAAIPDSFLDAYPGIADGFTVVVPEVLMRFGAWEEVLAEPPPRRNLPYATAMWRFTRAAALNALDRPADARRERALFLRAAKAVPADAAFGNNSAGSLLTIARHVLDGEIALRHGRANDAVRQLQRAAALEDSLRYDEPPDWLQPVRHSLGVALLAAGRAPEAEAAYRQDLARFPLNGWSLLGLSQALTARGSAAEAAEVRRAFERAWARADVRAEASCLCAVRHRG